MADGRILQRSGRPFQIEHGVRRKCSAHKRFCQPSACLSAVEQFTYFHMRSGL
jgi:hypothetical protein